MIDREAFRAWMVTMGYADSTITQSYTDAGTIARCCAEDEPIHPRLWTVARRLVKWQPALATELGEPFEVLLATRTAGRLGQSTDRVREARSMEDDNWRQLYIAVLGDPSPEARVLEVMMVSGVRVGDVLRLTRRHLYDGIRDGTVRFRQKGGSWREQRLSNPLVTEAYENLANTWRGAPSDLETVQQWLVGDFEAKYPAAYLRVTRKLKKLYTGPGRAHTHRLRRTVAMQAFRTTQDVLAVQQLLGHKSAATTQTYLDEARPDEVADLQDQMHNRFLKGAQ